MQRILHLRTLVAAVAATASVAAVLGVAAAPAGAASALGCTFEASAPWASGGTISTKLTVRCSSDRWLYWHARLTRNRTALPDVTAGSSDGLDLFQAGRTYTWYLTNNRDSCPGSGNYFGKLSIQSSSLGTAYVDRSFDNAISHC